MMKNWFSPQSRRELNGGLREKKPKLPTPPFCASAVDFHFFSIRLEDTGGFQYQRENARGNQADE
jgi:hypothetical protein